jgi:hypothetical protein
MLLYHFKGFKIVISFAVFHSVLSELHHLVDVSEYHEPGDGVDEAAGVRVQRLGEGEPGTGCCAIGNNLQRSGGVRPRPKTSSFTSGLAVTHGRSGRRRSGGSTVSKHWSLLSGDARVFFSFPLFSCRCRLASFIFASSSAVGFLFSRFPLSLVVYISHR